MESKLHDIGLNCWFSTTVADLAGVWVDCSTETNAVELEYGWKGLCYSEEAELLKGECCSELSSAHSYGQKSP